MIKAGIIGTGNIGTDLLLKLIKTDFIEPIIFAGRRMDSNGIKLAQEKGINVTDQGIQFFLDNPNYCNLIYDCTNAIDAKKHAKVFEDQGIKVIDLTPAKVGDLCVPTINPESIKRKGNVNMITCGGQASTPLLNIISNITNISGFKMLERDICIFNCLNGLFCNISIHFYFESIRNFVMLFNISLDWRII